MVNSNKLREKLRADLDVIAKRFISIYDLKYTENVSKLACPVTRWLDFRLRYVSPRPRRLVYSNKFPDVLSGLDPDIRAGWDILAKKIEIGEDINPYQGKGLIRINDTVRVLADLIELDPVFNSHVSKAGVANPVYGLTILQSGVSLYEEKSKIAFNLNVPSLPCLKLLQEDLFPKWALEKYAISDFVSEF